MNVKVYTHDVPDGEFWQLAAVPRIGEAIMMDRGNGPRAVRVRDVIWEPTSGTPHIYIQG